MRTEVIDAILDQLASRGFRGRVSPYLQNEPLLDRRLPRIIHKIKAKLPRCHVFISTNGDALWSDAVLEALVESGIDSVHVDCYDGRVEFETMVQRLRAVSLENRNVRVLLKGSLRKTGVDSDTISFLPLWIPEARPGFWNRGGLVDGVQPSQSLEICTFPFEQMYVNSIGQAVLCCSDWRSDVVFGNVVKDGLWEIWESPEYQRYRRQMRSGKAAELKLCSSCNRIA